MSNYSEDLLKGLTDEERAALMEPDDTTSTMENAFSGDEGGEKGAAAGEGGQGEAGEDKTQGNGAAGAGEGGEGDDPGQGDAAPAGADADNAAVQAQQLAPLLVAEAPADAEAKLKDIGDKKAALTDQFDNGDITAKEYQTSLDALNKDERAIERDVQKAQLAAEMRQQQETNNWLTQVQEFVGKTQPEYSASKVRYMALDAFVREIGSNPENANLTGSQILAMAHKRVVDDLGEATPAKTKAKQEGAPLKGSQAQPPKTLGKVPAADNNDLNDGKYASLDRLMESDPIAFEEKLASMSPTERDDYLARA